MPRSHHHGHLDVRTLGKTLSSVLASELANVALLCHLDLSKNCNPKSDSTWHVWGRLEVLQETFWGYRDIAEFPYDRMGWRRS